MSLSVSIPLVKYCFSFREVEGELVEKSFRYDYNIFKHSLNISKQWIFMNCVFKPHGFHPLVLVIYYYVYVMHVRILISKYTKLKNYGSTFF